MSNNNQENTNIFNTVEAVKSTFNSYFEMAGNKDFKQFYYDWHIDAMVAPFSELTTYFCENYGEQAPQKFAEFVTDFKTNVNVYNVDNPVNSSLKGGNYSVTNDGKLASTVDQLETFSFEFRQFIYSFASKKDHDAEFGDWPIKTNMPYAHVHGLKVASDILDFLNKNFASIASSSDKAEKTAFLADAYLRHKIAKDYNYNKNYTFAKRRQTMNQICVLREILSSQYQEMENSGITDSKAVDAFQIETKENSNFSGYIPNGFELEFYVPEEYGDYGKLISYLKEKNQWKGIYTSNKDAGVYNDAESAGVIMRDESLARYNGLAAVEYASKIMRSKNDEENCLKIFDSFDKGYVNVHCSLHQHVSAQNLDMSAYKRLVKRMMHFEKEIVNSFAAPERHDGKLLYATYISHNLSSNDKRDYPLLCIMVDMCDNKEELINMSCFGRKYKTLNILPKNTVEFRFMNAHFNKEFVSAFLQFNRDMVNGAINNSGTHINRSLINRYNWKQNRASDQKTVIKPLSYYYQVPYDSFRPQQTVSKEAIGGEQMYARLVVQALNQTGKLKYANSAFTKEVRNAYNR